MMHLQSMKKWVASWASFNKEISDDIRAASIFDGSSFFIDSNKKERLESRNFLDNPFLDV